MNRNILVMGGSYFIGRTFVRGYAGTDGVTLHVMNRGRVPLKMPGVLEYACDRHDLSSVKSTLPPVRYDAVVDFCAYEPRDIDLLLQSIPGEILHYIYIGSCAAFAPSAIYPKAEDSPKLKEKLPGPAGEYAYNKSMLEDECREICTKKAVPYTVLRPAFVYGPLNYAPRESFFFKLLLSGEPVPMPRENLALFQFVYVKDIGRMIAEVTGNPAAYNDDFNLSAPELISYGRLAEVFAEIAGRAPEFRYYSLNEINESAIPLPFPLEQHELYAGEKITGRLGGSYTPFLEGITESFDFYKKYVWK